MKRKAAVVRQDIVTWYTPEEKLPSPGDIIPVTISGSDSRHRMIYDHAFALASWFDDGEGWQIYGLDDLDDFTIHAWCDLEPYTGE